jgi:hypothetical protein
MRDYIGLFFVLILLTGGSVLIYNGILASGASAAGFILIGATLMALGCFTLAPVVRDWRAWWEWRKRVRKFENQ